MRFQKEILVALISAVASIGVAFLTANPVARSVAESTVRDTVADLKGVPVGTIIASMLPPAEFLQEMGDMWVPADGRNAKPDRLYYKITGNSAVPDLRGLFLRGMNVFDPTRLPRNDGYLDSTQGADSRRVRELSNGLSRCTRSSSSEGNYRHTGRKAHSVITEAGKRLHRSVREGRCTEKLDQTRAVMKRTQKTLQCIGTSALNDNA